MLLQSRPVFVSNCDAFKTALHILTWRVMEETFDTLFRCLEPNCCHGAVLAIQAVHLKVSVIFMFDSVAYKKQEILCFQMQQTWGQLHRINSSYTLITNTNNKKTDRPKLRTYSWQQFSANSKPFTRLHISRHLHF